MAVTEHLVDVAGEVEEEDNDMVSSLFIININILIKITIIIIIVIDTMIALDSHGGKQRFDWLSSLISVIVPITMFFTATLICFVPCCLQLSTGTDISTTRAYPGLWACSLIYSQKFVYDN